jgi:hypothetical protein
MKIFYNGDSWTWGYNLENRELRYPSLIDQHYDAESVDLSIHGCSNRTILRTTLKENIEGFDIGIINLTCKNRTEYYNWETCRWEFLNMGRHKGFQNKSIVSKKMQEYYEYVYTDTYGETDEWIAYTGIKNYFQLYNVPLILTTSQIGSKLNYDLILNTQDISRCDVSIHPNEIGHRRIYEKIITLVQNKIQNVETA